MTAGDEIEIRFTPLDRMGTEALSALPCDTVAGTAAGQNAYSSG